MSRVTVAVACFPPASVGADITIWGTTSYVLLVSVTIISLINPVVSSGNSNWNNCGSCTISFLASASSILCSLSISPNSPTLSAHSSYTVTFPCTIELLFASFPMPDNVPLFCIIPLKNSTCWSSKISKSVKYSFWSNPYNPLDAWYTCLSTGINPKLW